MTGNDLLLDLREAAACDRRRTGSKAAVLAVLLQAGLPVVEGVVLAAEASKRSASAGHRIATAALPGPVREALRQVADRYGDTPVAVRSSALAEDLPQATFAGQYETVLDVSGLAALERAVRRCWQSLNDPGTENYRRRMSAGEDHAMAILIQPMVRPVAAGVALGADPITGDRGKVLLSAVRGNAARLVSGEVVSEDWEVTLQGATCRDCPREVLTADQASAVAQLVWRIEALLGGPLDVEWAIAGGRVVILQARPMTSLPARDRWQAPLRGAWLRNIRLGEWLPEAVTPLFETWLLDRIEERFRQLQEAEGGIRARPPLHVCVNGWYFHSPIGSSRQTVLLRGILRRPRLAAATTLASRLPSIADRLFYRGLEQRWRAGALEHYRRLVADGEACAGVGEEAAVVKLIDRIADAVGENFWLLVLSGGAAWRLEMALARFYRRHLSGRVGGSYQVLLSGLGSPAIPGHAVHSLDWIHRTVGELPRAPDSAAATARYERTVAGRTAAEAACRQALATRPRQQARFIRLLDLAQRYAALRADQSLWFTLGWPLLRRCAHRLGERVSSAVLIGNPDDVFFLTRTELDDCLAGHPVAGLSSRVRQRRAEWERQRRLPAPLALGKPPILLAKLLLPFPKTRPSGSAAAGGAALRGTPASPGRAVGPVRILRDPADVRAVADGDVLVVSAAVPALTSVFGRIAALCVDGGSVAAHASLIAREYGIPAVTGLGDATARLTDGTLVIIDGTAGTVEPWTPEPASTTTGVK